MTTSNVNIANRALQKLGARRIDSLGEDSPNARSVATAFDIVRDRLLRKYSWNFAIARAQVAADAAQTTWGGLNRFRVPTDFLRLLRGDEAGTNDVERTKTWRIEGEYVVTDADAPLEFRYVRRVENPSLFDPLFAELLALTLAAEIADDITQDAGRVERIFNEKGILEAEARQTNAMENPSEEPPEDSWLQARL